MSPSYWIVRAWTGENRRAATYCQTADIVAGSGDALQSMHVDAIPTEAEVPQDSQQHEHLAGEGKGEARRYRVGRKIRNLADNVRAAGTPGRIC